MIDLEARYVTPEGVALAIAIVSPAFLLLSILAVAARLVERLIEGLLSIDDYLILGGTVCCKLPRNSAQNWNQTVSSHNTNIHILNVPPDNIRRRHKPSNLRHHPRRRHPKRPPQSHNAGRSNEVLHDLDPPLRRRPRAAQILHLHDDLARRRRGEARRPRRAVLPAGSRLGLLPSHLRRRAALLLARRGQLGREHPGRGPERAVRLRRRHDRHEPHRHGHDARHGCGVRGAAGRAAVEDEHEEAAEA